MSEFRKELEIVNGDGTDLEISKVSSHLNIAKPKTKNAEDKKKKIVIPQVKKKEESNDTDKK